jgi:hypothetical protein
MSDLGRRREARRKREAGQHVAGCSGGHPEGIRRVSGGHPEGIRWVFHVIQETFHSSCAVPPGVTFPHEPWDWPGASRAGLLANFIAVERQFGLLAARLYG